MRLDWDHLEVKLSACGYSQWERGVHCSITWPRSSVGDNDIWIFNAGNAVMDMRNGKIRLDKDSIIWMRPGHEYKVDQDPDDPIGHVFIHFRLIRPDGSDYFPDIAEIPEVFECFNYAHWHAMGRNIVRIMNLTKRDQSPGQDADIRKTASVLLKSLLMGIDLCDALARPDNAAARTNMIAIQAAEYFSDDLRNFQPIEAAARHFGLSRNHFTRIFTAFWHMPPQEYLIAQRIRRARHLLVNSDSTLEKIAASLGYSDRFFFARQFKEKTGIPPGVYRSRNGRKRNSP